MFKKKIINPIKLKDFDLRICWMVLKGGGYTTKPPLFRFKITGLTGLNCLGYSICLKRK